MTTTTDFVSPTRRERWLKGTGTFARDLGSFIWFGMIAGLCIFAGIGAAEIGRELGRDDGWVDGCAVFADPRACADAQQVKTLRKRMYLPPIPKEGNPENADAERKQRVAFLCKGLPAMLSDHAGCKDITP